MPLNLGDISVHFLVDGKEALFSSPCGKQTFLKYQEADKFII